MRAISLMNRVKQPQMYNISRESFVLDIYINSTQNVAYKNQHEYVTSKLTEPYKYYKQYTNYTAIQTTSCLITRVLNYGSKIYLSKMLKSKKKKVHHTNCLVCLTKMGIT